MSRISLLLLGVLSVAGAGSEGGQSQGRAPRVVHVTAERFAFTPSEIAINQGDVLEIRLTSDDTDHGFKIMGPSGPTDINVEIPKRGRGEIRVTFDAQEPGTYVFECSRVCGAGHGFMRGSIKVKAQ
jgi:cytochrome c oxidase subunit II